MTPEMEAFEIAISKTLNLEGKPSDTAGDKGGTTKYGISRRFLEAATGGPVSSAYVMGLTLDDAYEIYKLHFWHRPKIHRIPSDRVREIVFDQGVNRGTGAAIKSLQKALNLCVSDRVIVDGILGSQTFEAVMKANESRLVILLVQQCQLDYVAIVRYDETQLKFLAGWINRSWTYLT